MYLRITLMDPFECTPAELKCSRDIIIPDDMTLHAFHFVLQKAFGFYNEHLHDFMVSDEAADGDPEYFRPDNDDGDVEIYDDPSPYEYARIGTWLKHCYMKPYKQPIEKLQGFPGKTLWEYNTVADVMEKYGSLIYNYDYGDAWMFSVVKIKKSYHAQENEKLPVCVSATGPMLIEDVGGVYGMSDFLDALNGKEDDHGYSDDIQETKEWAKSQGWKKNVPVEKIL